MKKLPFISFVMCLFMCGCVANVLSDIQHAPKTPEENSWLESVLKEPLEFTMDAKDEEVAWSRAQNWISQYSGYKLKIVTNSIIETEGGSEGFKVTKLKNPDGTIQISVNNPLQGVTIGDMLFGTKDITVNLSILAHFIRTGDLPYPYLIRTIKAPSRSGTLKK